jgi:hypothetical protein
MPLIVKSIKRFTNYMIYLMRELELFKTRNNYLRLFILFLFVTKKSDNSKPVFMH